jgi:hypothetical protein
VSVIIVALLLAGAAMGWMVRKIWARIVMLVALVGGSGAMTSGYATIAGFLVAAFGFAFLSGASVQMMMDEFRKKQTD